MQDAKDDKIKYLWQKACRKCDIEQSPGIHTRQQNEVFERKGLWKMWHEQILGIQTIQDNEKRLRCQVTKSYINQSKNADDILKSCQQ